MVARVKVTHLTVEERQLGRPGTTERGAGHGLSAERRRGPAMVGPLVQAVVRFTAIVLLLVMAAGVSLGGLILLDRLISWMAGI